MLTTHAACRLFRIARFDFISKCYLLLPRSPMATKGVSFLSKFYGPPALNVFNVAGKLLAAIPHQPNAYGAIFGVGPVPTENSIMATHDRGLTTAVAIPSAKQIRNKTDQYMWLTTKASVLGMWMQGPHGHRTYVATPKSVSAGISILRRLTNRSRTRKLGTTTPPRHQLNFSFTYTGIQICKTNKDADNSCSLRRDAKSPPQPF